MPRCDHCLIEFPEHEAVADEIGGVQKVFCCSGCRAVYGFIHGEGLDAFYAKRHWDESGLLDRSPERQVDAGPFAASVSEAGGLREIDLYIDGIRCASCVWLTEKVLERTPGVLKARVNYATHRARVRWDPALVGLDSILHRVLMTGYVPKPYSESSRLRHMRAEKTDLLVRFGTAAFLSMQLMVYSAALYAGYFQGMDPATRRLLEFMALVLTAPIIFYSGLPFLEGTVRSIRRFRFTMDSLITIGAGSAFLYSVYGLAVGGKVYFDTAAMIVTLILLGRYIEVSAKGRASEAIDRLAELVPRDATRILWDEKLHAVASRQGVPVESLAVGDRVEVNPGSRIPVDGRVISGESEADESLITGESRPVHKAAGSAVIGGSINRFGSLIVEADRTGRDTMLAGIIRAVEDAQAAKPEIQTLADRVVGIFVPAIVMLAALTVGWHALAGASAERALMIGVSVLVIACPCSLGLATPLAVLLYTSMASSRGLLIKSAKAAEGAHRLSHVVFDKTGTLTTGAPELADVIAADPALAQSAALRLAASVEALSEHGIARAIHAAAAREIGGFAPLAAEGFYATPGMGVTARVADRIIAIGNAAHMRAMGIGMAMLPESARAARAAEERGATVVFMGSEGRLLASFALEDEIRPETRQTIARLRALGLNVSVVSGDTEAATRSAAIRAGIDEAAAGILPEGKKDRIDRMMRAGSSAVMVGDGINDAPALASAALGMAMGRGTDIAMESADAVLLRPDLRLVPYFIELSRGTFGIIKQNIFWSFFYNIVAVPLAMIGLLHPIVAAGAMAGSSLFVVVNSLRIRSLSARAWRQAAA